MENKDNSIEIIATREDKSPTVDGLIFYSPLKDYQRHVSVFGSSDGSPWQLLVKDGTLFDTRVTWM